MADLNTYTTALLRTTGYNNPPNPIITLPLLWARRQDAISMLGDDASCGLESSSVNTGQKHSGHSSEAPGIPRRADRDAQATVRRRTHCFYLSLR